MPGQFFFFEYPKSVTPTKTKIGHIQFYILPAPNFFFSSLFFFPTIAVHNLHIKGIRLLSVTAFFFDNCQASITIICFVGIVILNERCLMSRLKNLTLINSSFLIIYKVDYLFLFTHIIHNKHGRRSCSCKWSFYILFGEVLQNPEFYIVCDDIAIE